MAALWFILNIVIGLVEHLTQQPWKIYLMLLPQAWKIPSVQDAYWRMNHHKNLLLGTSAFKGQIDLTTLAGWKICTNLQKFPHTMVSSNTLTECQLCTAHIVPFLKVKIFPSLSLSWNSSVELYPVYLTNLLSSFCSLCKTLLADISFSVVWTRTRAIFSELKETA